MKDYLNSSERRSTAFICIVYGIIEQILDRKDKISKGEAKNLKYAHTYIYKYMEELLKRVGEQEGDRIYREASANKIELVPKSYDEGQLVVDKDAMEEVCRMAVETHCFGCKREDWHNCHLYRMMNKLRIGRIEDTGKRCEYYYEPIKEVEE